MLRDLSFYLRGLCGEIKLKTGNLKIVNKLFYHPPSSMKSGTARIRMLAIPFSILTLIYKYQISLVTL